MRRQLILVALVVLALRLPFLNQAFQGDDVLYLTEAAHAQIEPLHPKHTEYVFMGRDIDMRGQSHPPLNAWFLALLIAVGGSVSEIPFHAAYILFSLIAAFSALALARRFSPHPLLAILLFCATPAFVVNGTSLEADLPFVALWLLSTALYVFAVDRNSISLLIAASVAMALTALTAYQSILLVPILFLYGRKWRSGRVAAFTPIVVLLGWNIFERLSTGAMPAGVLANYMSTYGLQVFAQKIKSAVALTGHLAWLVFPALWIPSLYALPFAIAAAFYDWNPLFWGSMAVGTGILLAAYRFRNRRWVIYGVGAAGMLVILWFLFGAVSPLLPASF